MLARVLALTACGLVPLSLFGFSGGPPIERTGARVDGGLNCTACHRDVGPANADLRGRVAIEAASYRPGVRQTIRVTVEHPDAMRWGFQLIARFATDERRQAGTFEPVADRIRVRCAPTGANAPCNGEREFASHVALSTTMGSNGRATFEVNWTPPAEESGDIVFYAAGNATDGSAGLTGDLVYTTSTVIRSADGCAVSGAPMISGISNAASGAANTARNAITSIYGQNFGPAGRLRLPVEADLRLLSFPRQLGCVSVFVDGKLVPLTFAGPNQINFQAPIDLLPTTSVQVFTNAGLANERRSAAVPTSVNLVQPAFFQFAGSTSVAATHSDNTTYVAQPAVVPGGRPARAGDIVVLYATGLGLTQPVWASGDIVRTASRTEQMVTVRMGGMTVPAADVLFAGVPSQAISGLYQINVRVPAGLPAGNQPLSVEVGGVASQAGVTIPIMQ